MTEKKSLWQEIQTRDPKLAELLMVVKKVFGKPERYEVKLKEDKI